MIFRRKERKEPLPKYQLTTLESGVYWGVHVDDDSFVAHTRTHAKRFKDVKKAEKFVRQHS